MKHYSRGGSTAKRTLNCPGWIKESEGIPKQTSQFAMDGTALHDCFEDLILNEEWTAKDARDYIGQTREGVEITSDLVMERLEPAWESFLQLCNDETIIEAAAEVSASINDDIGGTADFVLTNKDTVVVGDLKTGFGIQVYPEDNAQGLFYAWVLSKGADSEVRDMFLGKKNLSIAIIQPNNRGEDTLRVWTTGIGAIDAFEQKFMAAYEASCGEDPALSAGGHCQFCPAAPICPQKTGQAQRALQMNGDDLEDLALSMSMVPELKAWISQVERTAHQQLEAGATVDGWKLVYKRATTRWNDEDEVIATLRRRLGGLNKITTRKILTPAQMLKLAKTLDKEIDISELTNKSSSGTTLAAADDKRPAVLSTQVLSDALNRMS